jgi:hypothetical protein
MTNKYELPLACLQVGKAKAELAKKVHTLALKKQQPFRVTQEIPYLCKKELSI